MFIFLHQNVALFKMKFNSEYDFVHKFRGINDYNILYNAPADYTEVGLTKNDDCWAIDIPFINATDEATPCHINGSYIGANHGHHAAIDVKSNNHGKTFKDIGSIWKDDNGVQFTLLRVYNEDWLLFISENVGKDENDYDFITKISGNLKYLSNGFNDCDITIVEQQVCDLRRANRYVKKDVYAITGDKEEKVFVCANDCDYGEIREEYYIINPSTVAPDLSAKRPKNGYTDNPDLAIFGKPMMNVKQTYKIMPDASIITDFSYTLTSSVNVELILGVMAQDKRNVFGGGIFRYMPKTLPITTPEGTFDFTNRVPVDYDNYPKKKYVTKEYWKYPDSPCERTVDYFKDTYGIDKMGFAMGYLPLFDGKGEIRKDNADNTIMLYYGQKLYPTFANVNRKSYRGVAYKKYFDTQKNNASYYTVDYDGKTYLYADFFEENVLSVPLSGKTAVLLEKDGNIRYKIEGENLTISSDKGFACFILE